MADFHAMGTSAAHRVHSGGDPLVAYAKVCDLLNLASLGCCGSTLDAQLRVQTGAGLSRYQAIPEAFVSVEVPPHAAAAVQRVLGPLRIGRDSISPARDGGCYVLMDLRPEVVTAFGQLPPLPAELTLRQRAIRHDLPQTLLPVVGRDTGEMFWRVCWPGEHDRSGIMLAFNESGSDHSVYVHHHPARAEEAAAIAAKAGLRILDSALTNR